MSDELDEKLRFNPRPSGLKRCSHCKNTKPLIEFYTSASSYDRYQSMCKPCDKELVATRKEKKRSGYK